MSKSDRQIYLQDIMSNKDRYIELYNSLEDDKSRNTLLAILIGRVTGDLSIYHSESDFINKQYFDSKIVKLNTNEVFVDCGGYVGDTTEYFINSVSSFNKIYIYEPDSNNYNKSIDYLSEWEKEHMGNIIIRKCGVGKENQYLSFSSGSGILAHIDDNGDKNVEIVTIDSDINEKISFIKMDVEGFEIDAIIGSKNHIINDKPKLAICVYHKLTDLLDIPEIIHKYNCNYKIYLRQYRVEWDSTAETVLYCI